jgi:hypothetical protein
MYFILTNLIRAKLSDEHFQILKDSFPLDIIDSIEYSWEDVTITNMANLFKYYFSGEKSINLFIY